MRSAMNVEAESIQDEITRQRNAQNVKMGS